MADELEEIDIGPRDRPRPTYVSAKLDLEYKQELINLLKEYRDCFAWKYYEMPGLSRSIIEHRPPIKDRYQPFKQAPKDLNLNCLKTLKRKSQGYTKPISFCNVDMPSGFQT